MVPESFETHPSRYRHWRATFDGAWCRLALDAREGEPLVPGYALKLNSYDLGVDLELADFVQRLRFCHPEVKAVIVTGAKERVFSAGANIRMLAGSSHPFKVNFCKFTNETRLAMEDASRHSGVKFLAAVNGTCAGGGYELALACDEIALVDDGQSAVSLPEVPLLGVLPGTGGLTRVVDKRRVRRDRADMFATLVEGIKGKRALEWGLVDRLVPKSRFEQAIFERAQELAARTDETPRGPAIELEPLDPRIDGDRIAYSHVELAMDRVRRRADLVVSGPAGEEAAALADIVAAGSCWWPLRAFRELDDALLRLRFHGEEVNVVTLRTRGDIEKLLAVDRTLEELRQVGLVREVLLHIARTLRRLDLTARSFFAVVDRESCFAGPLLELALAADRTYMVDDGATRMALTPLNFGAFPMSHGLTRLAQRLADGDGDPARLADREDRLRARRGELLGAAAADQAGLVTVRADDIDFDDELRVAVEERASLSPDALTGMEASLRFAGTESLATKIFGRLSAWQNWIFTRPNATGPTGALTRYGAPEQAQFDPRRT